MRDTRRVTAILGLMASVILPSVARAQVATAAPQPIPYDDPIPAARDMPFPGPIRIAVDATDTQRGIFRVREVIPVTGKGPLTLLYPKWLPGEHGPVGPIASLAGLTVTADGKALPWRRDPIDVYAFTVDVPKGVSTLEARFQFVSPLTQAQGRIVTSPDILNLQWTAMTLYPAGYFVRRIPIEASVTYPAGFRAATALEPASSNGDTITYKPVRLDVLIDSPVLAGRHVVREELCPGTYLNAVADTPDQVRIEPVTLDAFRNVCIEATYLFGGRHYDHYDFLLSVSDVIGGIGLEHHRSSENGVSLGYFTEWGEHLGDHDLIPHEYTHSWNGKFRRGADLWTPDYRTPMRDSLLWVYEGQTQFWGQVLAVRSGFLSKAQALDMLAVMAADIDATAGRRWRTVADTTNDPVVAQRRPKSWPSWQRSEDYYDEGALTWLEANAVIDRLSGGRHSLDDFAKRFFGMRNGDYGELTYTADDVVRTLDAIQPYDWSGFLEARIQSVRPRAPLEWIAQAGYQLVFTTEPNLWTASIDKDRKSLNLAFSLGMQIGEDGVVSRVAWDGPAFNAGVVAGATIAAINDRVYSEEGLRAAITEAARAKTPIRLLIKQGSYYRTASISYSQGLRYPHLIKTGKGAGALDRLLAPHRPL